MHMQVCLVLKIKPALQTVKIPLELGASVICTSHDGGVLGISLPDDETWTRDTNVWGSIHELQHAHLLQNVPNFR